jgi:hypothetical protein
MIEAIEEIKNASSELPELRCRGGAENAENEFQS